MDDPSGKRAEERGTIGPSWWLKGAALGLLFASGAAVWFAVNERGEGGELLVEDATLARADAVEVTPPAAVEVEVESDDDGPSPSASRWATNAQRMKLLRANQGYDAKDPRARRRCERNAAIVFDQLQRARIDDNAETLRLVDLTLEQPCMERKRAIILRIGVVAACHEKQAIRAQAYYRMADDPSLAAACPELLGGM